MTWKTLTTPQKTHLIASVWREGISASEIASAIGTTKSAVIGHYSRNKAALELFPLPMSSKRKQETGNVTDAVKRRNELRANPESKRNKTEPKLAPVPIDWGELGQMAIRRFPIVSRKLYESEYDDNCLYVRLVDCEGCTWPLNDGGPYLFCGHAKFGKYAYCEHHHERSRGRGTESERRAHRLSERHEAC